MPFGSFVHFYFGPNGVELVIKDKNIEAFLALVRAGLWKKEVRHLLYGNIDFDEVLYLAEEQSVVGLVAAGYEQVVDTKPPQEILL